MFNRRIIFRDITFGLHQNQTLLITGRNGAGKTTLVKIISDVLSPTAGEVTLQVEDVRRTTPHTSLLGLVSPYLQMYDEFSARENLQLALAMRGARRNDASIDALLKRINLFNRRDDPVRAYSSGMKQRVKYAFALIHEPPLLILDEPMANLDAEGVKLVRNIMNEQAGHGALIVATNDLSDVEHYDFRVDLNAAT